MSTWVPTSRNKVACSQRNHDGPPGASTAQDAWEVDQSGRGRYPDIRLTLFLTRENTIAVPPVHSILRAVLCMGGPPSIRRGIESSVVTGGMYLCSHYYSRRLNGRPVGGAPGGLIQRNPPTQPARVPFRPASSRLAVLSSTPSSDAKPRGAHLAACSSGPGSEDCVGASSVVVTPGER